MVGSPQVLCQLIGPTDNNRIGIVFLQNAPNEFLVFGVGEAQIIFTSDKPGLRFVGIESIDEQFFENGS